MKAKEITLNLTRNLGNYEFARMAITYEVNEGDDVVDSFKSAQIEINEAFDALFPDYYGVEQYVEKTDNIELEGKEGTLKTELIENSSEFNKIAKRIESGTMSISDVEEYYCLNDNVRKALEKLIRNEEKEDDK
jgi:hypothetical protein